MNYTKNQTQRDEILRLLKSANGAEVSLPSILALGIAQYNSRILELRRAGHRIENRTETKNGTRHSWFRLIESPARDDQRDCSTKAQLDAVSTPAFGTIKPQPVATTSFLDFEMGRRGNR